MGLDYNNSMLDDDDDDDEEEDDDDDGGCREVIYIRDLIEQDQVVVEEEGRWEQVKDSGHTAVVVWR